MDDFTQLFRPEQSQIQIDPTPRPCPSDGFNYPSFHLVNKQARLQVSQPFNLKSSNTYQFLAIANSRGWFAAVRNAGSSPEIVLSSLDALRLACKAGKEGAGNTFSPSRLLRLSQGQPTIIAFACNDTRLLVGLEEGSILAYETTQLLAPGSEDFSPAHSLSGGHGSIKQILPNPSTEEQLVNTIAVVFEDGHVLLFDAQLNVLGGWVAGNSNSVPVVVAWSPKGKHIAIGLKAGDILTFALSNRTTPNKHIPPTAEANLVSMHWLGPGHTFRTSYAPYVANASEPSHHIINLDKKSPTATYFAPTHPFPVADRTQRAYVLSLPRWDEDASTTAKHIVVVGDASSVDLEIIANSGDQWHQCSQENPLTLPLDQAMEDTMLVALDCDLTDIAAAAPIMYAYLNDGTVQAWYLQHGKPYAGIVDPNAVRSTQPSAPPTVEAATSTAFSQQGSPSAFATPSQTAFGQSSFGTTAFSKPLAFGQSSYGQISTLGFGQTTSTSLGQNAIQGAPSFGSSGFSKFASGTASFGQQKTQTTSTSFGQNAIQEAPSFGSTGFSKFASGAASFGQQKTSNMSLDRPSQTSTPTSVFGAPQPSGFVKSMPSAFGLSNAGNTFGQLKFGSDNSSPVAPAAVTREASMSDSSSAGFAGMSLGESNSDATSKAGIFGSFMSPAGQSPTPTFGGASIKPSAGFGAFSNYQTQQPVVSETSKTSGSSTLAFSSNPQPATTSAFGQPAFGRSTFGQAASGVGRFSTFASGDADKSSSTSTPVSPSPAPSIFKSSDPAPKTGAFGNLQTTPSAFKPASGFGAFADTTVRTSPFMKKKEEEKSSVSVFSSPQTNKSSTPRPSVDENKAHDMTTGAVAQENSPESILSTSSVGGSIVEVTESATREEPEAPHEQGLDKGEVHDTGDEEEEEIISNLSESVDARSPGASDEELDGETGSADEEAVDDTPGAGTPVLASIPLSETCPISVPLQPEAPSIKVTTSPNASLGLGLGRPSTRPVRSSPLASAAVLGNEDEVEEVKKTAPKATSPNIPISPEPVLGHSSAHVGRQVKFESFEGAEVPSLPSPGSKPYSAMSIPPEATMEAGMQKECANIVFNLHKELEFLRKPAGEANMERTQIARSAGGSRKKSDLSDPTKWTPVDAVLFGQVLRQYEADLVRLSQRMDQYKQVLRDIQGNMLKANTRKEGIVRFNKAKNDTEFSKMLRSRTLGPEHLETQTQLRRNIEAMRDRVQKLEANLQALKKRLVQTTSGKVGLRAPSLDTVNRTYRNIDLAIAQQSDEIQNLADRIRKIKLTTPDSAANRDARLPDPVSRRPYSVTPHVAVTTAAALNAERSAHKLKKALLSVRSEPLLNTKAVSAPPAPLTFSTPEKVPPLSNLALDFPLSGPLFPPQHGAHRQFVDWALPEDSFSLSVGVDSPLPPTRRGAGVGPKKHGCVPLKKGTGTPLSPTIASFDWGPLPTFNNPPLTKLAADIPSFRPSPKNHSPGGDP